MTDLSPSDLSHLSDEEFNALAPQGHHAPGPEPLSPAAQAVLDAINKELDEAPWDLSFLAGASAAAALRAAADQIAPETVNLHAEEWLEHPTWVQVESRVRLRLLAIADELEAQ